MKFIIIVFLFYPCLVWPNTPAFPGAEGGGAIALGGRGGKIYEVTRLADDNKKGSLRYGIEQLKEPRIIVFKVGGYIHLKKPLRIQGKKSAYLTIAGQTAPGPGITLSGKYASQSLLYIEKSHDIVIRYLKIRHGGSKPKSGGADGIEVKGGSYNIIIDHISASWAHDENIGIFANKSGEIHNITVQWSILSEGLNYNNHANGLLAGSLDDARHVKNISLHHNLFIHNMHRNPLLVVESADIVNNIIYNWRWWATGIGSGIEVDIVGNHYKTGRACCLKDVQRREIILKPYHSLHKRPKKTGIDRDASIYLVGNSFERGNYFSDKKSKLPSLIDPRSDKWNSVLEQADMLTWGRPILKGWSVVDLPKKFRRHKVRRQEYPITTLRYSQYEELENLLFNKGLVGASQRLSEQGKWLANRDAVDQRLLREYRESSGKLLYKISAPESVDARVLDPYHRFLFWPQVASVKEGYKDSDRDGMPDQWEKNYQLNAYHYGDNTLDLDGDGYTNIEEFLNGTDPNIKELE